ncbi:AzlC family ABC transporter permease [Paenibacillus radicis (ex Gao et al. 2016)]|uniref:Branched-chain amino acid ABC transporter permease n=1 Tax=Paenibacillus radicis (ex Gao et al. 2016) TaxID=1737354 RepID=A0A917GXW2_9BACL|nr:AzlC family ABC transporter permease [Paenibacillus radicis (ex Gao et al. 2016)]GGG61022.1 branched-chain amino acid ABC transporter permease [Paenibacillus radicis (ex Gao et al. 2016)]
MEAHKDYIPAPAHAVEVTEDTFLQGIKDCIPTLLGYLSIGFAAGVVGHTSGLSIVEITLMSLLIYAGSAQFIVAGMLAAQGSAIAIIATVFIVNLRHMLLSAALSPYFRQLTPLKTMLIGSLLTDETFGVAINQTAKRAALSAKWMNGLNLTAYLNWIVATVAGAFFGQWITDPEKYGLHFALPAMFIGLLVIQIMSRGKIRKDLVVAISAGVIVIGASFVLSGSMAVIAATVVAATLGVVVEKWK